MENRMILVIGGARSGKSSFAQDMAADSGRRVCFLATAEARDGEMSERIHRHRLNRPAEWKTQELEDGIRLGSFPEGVDLVLFDCFTIYLANLMAANGLDWEEEDEDLLSEEEVLDLMDRTEAEALRMLDEVSEQVDSLIIVSNEVGTGLVPPFRLGRIFRDLAGRLNQKMARRSDEVFLVSAGLPLRLKPGETEGKHG
jgi:adenosylcobinamide kinase / adenosylcobinamide-phosphate guanylyltransferase